MSDNHSIIPDEAVEAAARAMHAAQHPPERWGERPDHQVIYRERARLALEAAERLIKAEAWDEGAAAAKTRQDGIEDAIYGGQSIPDGPLTNPYH